LGRCGLASAKWSAGLSPRQVFDQRDDFKRLLQRQCVQIGSEWMPVLPNEDQKGAG
jgi:hypothetical protein